MNTPLLYEASKLFLKKTPKTRDEALIILRRVESVCKQLREAGFESTANALKESYKADIVFMGFALNVTIH